MAWVNRFGISRREQDEFALRSHQNAAKAHKDGIYVEEVRCGAMGYGPVADAMQHCDSSVFLVLLCTRGRSISLSVDCHGVAVRHGTVWHLSLIHI